MFDRKEYMKQYAIKNKDKIVKQSHQYYEDNKEKINIRNREYMKVYRQTPENKMIEKQWRQSLKGKICYKKYGQSLKGKIANKKYGQDIKGIVRDKKHCSKRKRLGFIPLNKPFENCEAHHISENFIIYIPKEIHKSLKHIIWNWHNMEKINQLAFKYF